ncbi:ETC complex I subunit conserved region-domain-containing protein [Mycena vulgaris]|nr:ETC complex I subunit conserved region-domain-containing protein [Mycena vulgaris]
MLRLTRPLFQALRSTTGLTGLAVHPDPIPVLTSTYQSTLAQLAHIPETSVYRQATEALVQNKLNILKAANTDVAAAEKGTGRGDHRRVAPYCRRTSSSSPLRWPSGRLGNRWRRNRHQDSGNTSRNVALNASLASYEHNYPTPTQANLDTSTTTTIDPLWSMRQALLPEPASQVQVQAPVFLFSTPTPIDPATAQDIETIHERRLSNIVGGLTDASSIPAWYTAASLGLQLKFPSGFRPSKQMDSGLTSTTRQAVWPSRQTGQLNIAYSAAAREF